MSSLRYRAFRSAVVLASVVMITRAGSAGAQSNGAVSGETDYCLGFAFGSWTPPLDLKAAGHNPVVDTTRFMRAPGGRDWAMSGAKTGSDSTIMLFPIWWPAGVVIHLEHMPSSPADTVRGRAFALVADGRKDAPASAIRAWEKRCGG